MGLNRLTDRIYYLEHEPETDRPMLAYIRGDKWSLAIDAGYSSSHVADFYGAIEAEHLKKPDFTVITHWHYDHTFGMHAVSGVSIAHENSRSDNTISSLSRSAYSLLKWMSSLFSASI